MNDPQPEGHMASHIERRKFLATLGGAAVAWPIAARAQQPVKPVRIGYLSATSAPDANMDIFRQGMGTVGYVEGRDFVLEARFAHRDYSRFPALVEELLSTKVVLIVLGGPASRAAPFAEKSVPVVFGFSGDPVDAGIISSFARPGGNATGISFLQLDLAPKRVDLLKEAVPSISKVAVLSNPDHAGDVSELRATRDAAGQRGLALQHFEVRTDDSFKPTFTAISQSGCNALLTFPDALTFFHRRAIADFALREHLPSIFGWKPYAEAGGMMSYGPILRDNFARLAVFVDKILKGAKPNDLPVEQPTKFELVINLKTAKALRLEVPWFLQQRADEVIE
jgi:putative tryptophan/tyrosine transport system substrate-binding protein